MSEGNLPIPGHFLNISSSIITRSEAPAATSEAFLSKYIHFNWLENEKVKVKLNRNKIFLTRQEYFYYSVEQRLKINI